MSNQKTLRIVTVCCIIGLIVINTVIATMLFRQSKYTECSAEIMNISYDEPESGKGMFMILSYNYNNRDYTIKQYVPSTNEYNIGDNITIRFNPDNPTEIQSTYIFNNILLTDIFLIIFTAGVFIFAYKKKKSFKQPNLH